MLFQYKDIRPVIGQGVYVAPTACVIGDVVIGDRSSVWFGAVLRGDIDRIRVGCDTSIQDGVIVHVTGGRFPTLIGDRVIVGHGAVLHGCTLHDDVLIGMGATVLDGAVVESGAMVAAGTLIREGQTVPAGMLAAGVPATVRRPLTDTDRNNMVRIINNYRRETNLYASGVLQPLDDQ